VNQIQKTEKSWEQNKKEWNYRKINIPCCGEMLNFEVNEYNLRLKVGETFIDLDDLEKAAMLVSDKAPVLGIPKTADWEDVADCIYWLYEDNKAAGLPEDKAWQLALKFFDYDLKEEKKILQNMTLRLKEKLGQTVLDSSKKETIEQPEKES